MNKTAISVVALATLVTGCTRDDIDFGFHTDDNSTPIVLTDPGLAWSASACEATIGKDNTFPTLTNPNGVSVSYSSSDTGIATVSESGAVTLVAAGNVSITAASTANATYAAASVSYRLTVRTENGGQTQGNDGAGSYVFDSTGDPSSDDDISKTTFTRMVTVTFAELDLPPSRGKSGESEGTGSRGNFSNPGALFRSVGAA